MGQIGLQVHHRQNLKRKRQLYGHVKRRTHPRRTHHRRTSLQQKLRNFLQLHRGLNGRLVCDAEEHFLRDKNV